MNILVTGYNGQLANEIKTLAASYKDLHRFVYTTEKELDITQKEQVASFIDQHNIECIINCAAYTDVDGAEDDEEGAFRVNDMAVGFMAEIAQQKHIFLMHISTDYVFNGRHFKPYTEQDPTNPDSIYGKSKKAGELKILEKDAGMIIRTSWLYSATGKNFVNSIARLANEREELNVVFDQIGNPTYARDLAGAILTILETPKEKLPKGIFHYSNEGVCSWYDFALEIRNLLQLNCKIHPIESKDFPTRAARPHFSVLNKAKIKETFQIKIPYWKDSLREMLKNFKN